MNLITSRIFFTSTTLKMIVVLLIAIACTALPHWAMAKKVPLACQDDAKAGLEWNNGAWQATSYVTGKFILAVDDTGLVKDSVAKVFGLLPHAISCTANLEPERTLCTTPFGTALYFDYGKLRGGVAQLFGVTSSSKNRDSVTISAFTCSEF